MGVTPHRRTFAVLLNTSANDVQIQLPAAHTSVRMCVCPNVLDMGVSMSRNASSSNDRIPMLGCTSVCMHVHMPMRAHTHAYAHPLSLSVRVTDRVVPFCESENVSRYDLELAQLALDADVNDGHVYLVLVILANM